MSNQNTITTAQMRQFFKVFNRFMILAWRLGLGSFGNRPELAGQIMVLTQTGRKSGHRRRTPVNYTIQNGDIYCVAGFGAGSDWYRNVMSNPQVEIWLPQGWWAGLAEDVTGCPEHISLMRSVMIASGFAARSAGVYPLAMSDDELHAATDSYRLVRIRRSVARTGIGGPGDLAWFWPIATFFMLPLALRGLSRRGR